MSYYNHRNYQLNHAARRAAQVAQNNWTQSQNNQLRAINRVKGDDLRWGSLGDPDRQSWLNYHIAHAAQPGGDG